jgi:hypothetical protein
MRTATFWSTCDCERGQRRLLIAEAHRFLAPLPGVTACGEQVVPPATVVKVLFEEPLRLRGRGPPVLERLTHAFSEV